MTQPKSYKAVKILIILLLSIFAVGSLAFSILNKPTTKETVNTAITSSIIEPIKTPNPAKRHILVRYFHTSVRCSSCKTIEAYADEAIHAAFATELQNGNLIWNSVNLETPGFEHFIQDFQLTNKSIIVTEENTEKPRQWKNLQRIWEILNDKAAFMSYVQQEIRLFLKGA